MPLDILSASYFELFGIPVTFDYDEEVVQSRYRDLQKIVHPDNFVNSSAQERRISMQQSARINEAFNALKNPVERALYMLRLQDLEINFENETTMDAEFLMQQLDFREILADVRNDPDPLKLLDELNADVKNKISQMSKQFSGFYESGDHEQAKEIIRKMQFMQKAEKEINEIIASIEDEMFG